MSAMRLLVALIIVVAPRNSQFVEFFACLVKLLVKLFVGQRCGVAPGR